MIQETYTILRANLTEEHYNRLMKIKNENVHRFIAKYIRICKPSDVYICDDSEEDRRLVRESALVNREEAKLKLEGHTVHFDNYYDQARDKSQTKFLVTPDDALGEEFNTIPREEGLEEIHLILNNIMKGKRMWILFLTLGPSNSIFTIPCLQLTDSAYVAHSEQILYRPGYEEFVRRGRDNRFFKFVHSQGELEEAGLGLKVSRNLDQRRIYIDLRDETIYSANTQYGGNTIGLKKLAMRLSIRRAIKEGWLTEHMFIMGVNGPNGRVTYFTGAFPSMCGKTATAMIPEERIVGDDIAFLRKVNGEIRAVNVEKGMFGIITGVNSTDDPILWKALTSPNEVIFSNVLVTDDRDVYWLGKNGEPPKKGVNHSGEWYQGKKDSEGGEIPPAHKNARFTIEMKVLDNIDPRIEDPEGVKVEGIIYGGRDSDTWVPVEEAFDWVHGIITKGASLESETTAATLGKEGVREFNPMANLDFLSVPIGEYIRKNIEFGANLKNPPKIFAVNYFLKGIDGKYKTGINDKKVYLKWMELRVHNEVGAIKTPTGYVPFYADLKKLFQTILGKDYTIEDYVRQFSTRVTEQLQKVDRIIDIYSTKVPDTPPILFKVLEEQKKRLLKAQDKFGPHIPPFIFSALAKHGQELF
ncbi:MAG: phosphoenolpyruvate carboxykinase (GTP) [Candidatus Odinarchaeum yellowstonii]|uniref:Phosphoenolpyruvate carboxykinase [GTP] n=1 Tax=Odinarchaeota yellowstonii (strain LCB_4) TaxID=1841599 RepID=A0AAF0D3N3_ODILC|nr:MAG: phosphoenolpyruvate carboxykinase (GTP) [Candidatus Odinarchaeum yellowstonii]